MRSGLLCLLCGCNQIFGSHTVVEVDAAPADAAPYPMLVTGMNVDTTTGITTTLPLPNVAVEIGPITAEAPKSVDVDPTTGGFEIPYMLAQVPYRLVYHPPDGVPVEIQSTLHAAHFVVPSLGRLDAEQPPGNAQTGDLLAQSSYNNLRVVSTGTWAFRFSGMVGGIGSSVTWTTASDQADPITSMSGPLETPNSGRTDNVLLIDGSIATPEAADGFAVGTMTTFGTSGLANLSFGPWKNTTTLGVAQLQWDFAAEPATNQRLVAASGIDAKGDNGTPNLPFAYGGVFPTTGVANFLETGAPLQVVSQPDVLHYKWAARGVGGLGVPSFVPLAKVNSPTKATFIDMFNGTDQPAYPTGIYLRMSMTRFTEGIAFTSGLQTVWPIPDGNPTKANVTLAIGLAYKPGQHMMLGDQDIWVDSTTPPHISRTELIPFTYATDGVVDDCMATLYRIDGTSLSAVRRFLSQSPPSSGPILIDPSAFDATHHYVFGIACHAGLPGVATFGTQLGGDWSQVAYPFSESMLYSYPFVVP